MVTNFKVAALTEKDGKATYDQRWAGENLTDALAIATYEYLKEVVLVECKEERIKVKHWHTVNMNYAPKVKCRIIVFEEIGPRQEAAGKLPYIIKSYGNEAIKMFQRVHFD
jgi:hypothetical protein